MLDVVKFIDQRKSELERTITKLMDEKQQIEKLIEVGKTNGKNAVTMKEILKFRQTEAKQDLDRIQLVPKSINATSMVFTPMLCEFVFFDARRITAQQDIYESETLSKHEFKWKMSVRSPDTTKWEFALCLEKGLPGRYQVAMGSAGPVPYSFAAGTWVELEQAYETPREPRYLYNSVEDVLTVLLAITKWFPH